VHFCGDDHLDSDRVVLKAKTEKKQRKAGANGEDTNGSAAPTTGAGKQARKSGKGAKNDGKRSKASQRQAEQEQNKLLTRIDTAEARMQEIDAAFCAAGFYDRTPASEVKELQIERSELELEVQNLTTEWERTDS